MIYKNGITVEKIELLNGKTEINCHIFLSNGKIYTGKPEKIDPSILHNQMKLETISILTIAQTLKRLRKEMEK